MSREVSMQPKQANDADQPRKSDGKFGTGSSKEPQSTPKKKGSGGQLQQEWSQNNARGHGTGWDSAPNDQQQALASELSRRSMAKDAGFNENDHPRANNGQFGSGGGSKKSEPVDVPTKKKLWSQGGGEASHADQAKHAHEAAEKAESEGKEGSGLEWRRRAEEHRSLHAKEDSARKKLSKDNQAHEYTPDDLMGRYGVSKESANRLHKEIQSSRYGKK